MDKRTEDRGPERQRRVVLEQGPVGECARVLTALFDELVALDLDTGCCRTIFYTQGKNRLSINRTVEELQAFARSYVHPDECRQFQAFFEAEYLKEQLGSGGGMRLVFRQRIPAQGYVWVEAVTAPSETEDKVMLCYVSDLGREEQERCMLKHIVDRYVYRDCDYFLCLDADSDTYDLLQKNDSQILTLLPAFGCYSRQREACISQYVVLEDRERLLKESSVDHVLDVLEREGELVVTYGVIGQDAGYLRKQLRYSYYDRQEHKILLMRRDITEEYMEQCRQKKRLSDALLHARIDFLTGLYNRQAINLKVDGILNESGAPPSALLFIDLDNFKSVNDTLGHAYGDKVLCHVADCFRQVLRSSDLIGRVGGDEFVAFLPGISSPDQAGEYAGRLCQAVSRIEGLKLGERGLSCSIGGAVCPLDGRDYHTLLQKADIAVYEAKRRGKNQFAFYRMGMRPHSSL